MSLHVAPTSLAEREMLLETLVIQAELGDGQPLLYFESGYRTLHP